MFDLWMSVNLDLAGTFRYLGAQLKELYSNMLTATRRHSWFVLLFTCLANTLDSLV